MSLATSCLFSLSISTKNSHLKIVVYRGHPYTKIDFVANELQVSRQTAARYLDEIVSIGLLSKHKVGKENYYLNDDLFQLLSAVGQKNLV